MLLDVVMLLTAFLSTIPVIISLLFYSDSTMILPSSLPLGWVWLFGKETKICIIVLRFVGFIPLHSDSLLLSIFCNVLHYITFALLYFILH